MPTPTVQDRTTSSVWDQLEARVTLHWATRPVPFVLSALGHATVDMIRMKRQDRRPLTRADLEEIAERWGARIDDLWPALDSRRHEDDDLDELEETA